MRNDLTEIRARHPVKTVLKRYRLTLVIAGAIILLALIRPFSGLVAQEADGRTGVVRYVPTQEKVVALTFDDGPHPVFTPEILRILAHYHARATFFMIGERMEKYPRIVKDVLEAGDAIGNHTYTHPHLEKESAAKVADELERCEQVIERQTGHRSNLFRPPRGYGDATIRQIAGERGYRTILWWVCADHHDAPTPQMMAMRVLRRVRPGAIILAHDGDSGIRWKDVAATPLIIQGLLKRGYRFVTVPELLGEKPETRRIVRWL
jgi:peptidoglycan/xylan/chitin deacetylase (PgdA/CDA1 family)